jgi:Uncharacterized conserved protein (some members contain a von Willebrand factor type A (vWA) domain)
VINLTITRRFIILLLSGLLLLSAAAVLHFSLTVFIIFNMVCFAALIIDYFITSDNSTIEIERSGEESLSLYEKESIEFMVYNKNDFIIYIEIKDEVPDFHFKTENTLIKGFVKPHEKKHFEYQVTPTKRGAFTFGNIHIRYRGKLKLCMRIFKVKLDREYKVYPNLKNLRKYRLGICNNRMYKQGQRNLKMLGRGSSFESLKEYTHGDEYRRINWKATARANKPVVNQYEPEKNQHVHILLDTGRPMSFTVRGYRKLDLAVNTALVLSDIVNRNGDLSGLMHFNTGVGSMILPGKGTGHRQQMLNALYHLDHTNLTSNFSEAFYYFKKKERHRSIIFIFTDFETTEEAEELLRVIPVISRNNIVIIPLIRNESYRELISARAENMEELIEKGVALELLDERSKIIQLLNRRGIYCFECTAEKLEFSAVNKYIQIKNQTYM